MKGSKAITIIGIFIMVLVAASYILFEAFVKDTSNVTAQNVVVAKAEVPEGTVIHNVEEAKTYFTVKRISAEDVVEGAIVVNRTDLGDAGLIAMIQEKLEKQTVTDEDVASLVGYKITRNYAKNEQVLASYVSKDITEFAANERLFPVETSYVGSVAAEINEGDYVDLWLVSTKDDVTVSKKLIGPLKIYKLKTGDNVTIGDTSTAIPSVVLFKLDEEKIEYISTLQTEGTIFFVKYGNKPSQEDIDSALENAIKENGKLENETEDIEVEITYSSDDVNANENTNNAEETVENTETSGNNQ